MHDLASVFVDPAPPQEIFQPDHGNSGSDPWYLYGLTATTEQPSGTGVTWETAAYATDGGATSSHAISVGFRDRSVFVQYGGFEYGQELLTVPLAKFRPLVRPLPADYQTVSAEPRFGALVWEVQPATQTLRYGPRISMVAEDGSSLYPGPVDAGASVSFARHNGTVVHDTTYRAPYIPGTSLPPAEWSASGPWTTGTGVFDTIWQYPDFAAGDGIAITVDELNTVDRIFVLGFWEYNRNATHPAAAIAVAASVSNFSDNEMPKLYVTFGSGTYHYVFYDGPTTPTVNLAIPFPDSLGAYNPMATWGEATTDQGSVGLYEIELRDYDTNQLLTYGVSQGDPTTVQQSAAIARSFTFDNATLRPGGAYYARVRANDSVGWGAWGVSGPVMAPAVAPWNLDGDLTNGRVRFW